MHELVGQRHFELNAIRLVLQRLTQQFNGLLLPTMLPKRVYLFQNLIRRTGAQLINHCAVSRFRLHPDQLLHDLALPNHHHRRQAAHPEMARQSLLGVGVDLGENETAPVFLGQFGQQGGQRLAGLAPVGPEIHQHRHALGVFHHRGKVLLINIKNVGRFAHYQKSTKAAPGGGTVGDDPEMAAWAACSMGVLGNDQVSVADIAACWVCRPSRQRRAAHPF